MFVNRKTLSAINALKSLWGVDRFAQTNSRKNGNYVSWVRLYQTPEDKRSRKNYIQISTWHELLEKIHELTHNKGAACG